MVGRTPWSAADAPVGQFAPCKTLTHCAGSGTGASRATQGVRPTNAAGFAAPAKTMWHYPVSPPGIGQRPRREGWHNDWGCPRRCAPRTGLAIQQGSEDLPRRRMGRRWLECGEGALCFAGQGGRCADVAQSYDRLPGELT